jgi:hypothetical protein
MSTKNIFDPANDFDASSIDSREYSDQGINCCRIENNQYPNFQNTGGISMNLGNSVK